MSLKVETDGDIVVVRPVGRVDAVTVTALQEGIDEALRENPLNVVIDMIDVPYISSAGLRVFIRVAKTMNAASGKLAVCNLNDNARQVFDLAGFDKILTLCDDLESAKAFD